jgi:hypothetical protein
MRILLCLTPMLLFGCYPVAEDDPMKDSGDAISGVDSSGGSGDNSGGDNSGGDNSGGDNSGGNSECADYRAGYPDGPYGYSIGSILEEFPGMVDGDGNTQSVAALHQDKSKKVLVIANAFDT